MRILKSVVLTFLLAATALAQTAPLPYIPLSAGLDRVLRDYEKAWTGKDPAALAELFTEDGFVMSDGKPPVRGREAIREAYANAGGPLVLRAYAQATSGPIGYIIGAYGSESEDTGKFILALRRGKNGRWLIAADIDNSNRRAGAPAPPTGSARDEQAIRSAVQTMARAVDLHQWDTVGAAFAPSVRLDYGTPESLAPEQIVARWQPLLSSFDWTRHETPGMQVKLDAENARVESPFVATHFLAGAQGGDTWVLKGRYEFDLKRSPGGWKITSMRMVPGDSTGNAKLLELARARMAAN